MNTELSGAAIRVGTQLQESAHGGEAEVRFPRQTVVTQARGRAQGQQLMHEEF